MLRKVVESETSFFYIFILNMLGVMYVSGIDTVLQYGVSSVWFLDLPLDSHKQPVCHWTGHVVGPVGVSSPKS